MEHISNHLSPGNHQPSKELLRQESKKLRTGDETRFVESLQSKRIAECTYEEIKEVLRYVMIKIGLRAQNFPNDIEKLILVEHIQQEFGGHRLQEIKLAFDLGIGGKLDAEINCYENFSCLYFTNIMFAYRKWSKEAYEQNYQDIVKPEAKQLEYSTDPKKEIQELLELYIEDKKKGLLKIEYVMPSLYDKLVLHELITHVSKELSLDEKREFLFNHITDCANVRTASE